MRSRVSNGAARVDLHRRQLLVSAAGLVAGVTLTGAREQPSRATHAAESTRPQRIIIDTDPGVDDALAILLALRSPEVKIEALTAVAGNVELAVTLLNALKMVEIASRPDIPVAAGASEPLKRRLVTAADWHGKNGLAGVEFPEPRTRPAAESATQIIRRLSREFPHEVSIVAIGPLTNLALAFRQDPELPKLIRGITIMGGSLSGGNMTPAAEFNSYVDPEAAQAVYHSGAQITMIGLDVTRKTDLTEHHIRMLESARNPLGSAAGRIMRAMLQRVGKGDRLLVHDALAVAAVIDPSLVTLQDFHIEVETEGTLTAGETVGYRDSPMLRSAPSRDAPAGSYDSRFEPNAKVAVDVDADRFMSFLITRLVD